MLASLFVASDDQINTLYLNAVRRSHVSGRIFVSKSFSFRIPKRQRGLVDLFAIPAWTSIHSFRPCVSTRQTMCVTNRTEQDRTGQDMLVGFVSGIWLRYLSLLILSNHHPPGAFGKIWTHSEKRTYGVPIQNPKRKHSRPLTEVWTVPVSVCSKCDTCFKIECPFLDVTTHESKPALVVEVWNGIDLIPDCHINDLSRVAFLTQEFEIDSP